MKYSEELFAYMAIADDPEAPDGAWQARLEDAVEEYNQEHKTNYDPFEAWLAYIKQQ